MKKIRVCRGKVCQSFGADRIMDEIVKSTGVKPGQSDDKHDVDFCGCLGYCGYAPNVEVDEEHIVCQCEADTVMERIEHAEDENCIPSAEDVKIEDTFLGDI
ncbi:MAG: hypothetical protein HOE80_03320 [Candidatus Magasanikbacteria bacterium]|jgi:NADH:ubiquinone oxidoreductase subunit E|nr:hypothetical protein [Candidatus Magasanikbacteria bacterium]MBT4071727.1 hypothetical protein [Candidatus Magasanikbacteria bacterium]